MTENKRHVHADLIIAWANGAEIEYRTDFGPDWLQIDSPAWNYGTEYRIKPKTVDKWQWVAQYANRPLYVTQHLSDDELSSFEHVKFIQKVGSTKITVEE